MYRCLVPGWPDCCTVPGMIDTNQLARREFWLAFAPRLHIDEASVLGDAGSFQFSPEVRQDIDGRLKFEGYFQLRHNWGVDLALMAETVRQLSAQNIPPVFGYLFDEFWIPFHALAPLYKAILGDYAMLPDFWIWNVDPSKGDAGWKPHRDRGYDALFADGSPKSLTTWIPLSRATPGNSCIYVIPAHMDSDYAKTPDPNWRPNLPDARALSAEPGDFLIWNQALLHWGSRTSPYEKETRVSMAFEFQRTDVPPFNTPLLDAGKPLSFDERIRLIAKQVLQYRHMYTVQPAIEQMANRLLKS